MNTQISNFFWSANADNCIAILNYEFQSVCEVVNDSYHNDASPSCTFTIDGITYKLFFPSDYQGDYAQFVLFDSTDYSDEQLIGEYTTIGDVLNHFKSINVI